MSVQVGLEVAPVQRIVQFAALDGYPAVGGLRVVREFGRQGSGSVGNGERNLTRCWPHPALRLLIRISAATASEAARRTAPSARVSNGTLEVWSFRVLSLRPTQSQ
jgi:hypothetical protein